MCGAASESMALLRREDAVDVGSRAVHVQGSEVLYTADSDGLGGSGSGSGRQSPLEDAVDEKWAVGRGMAACKCDYGGSRCIQRTVTNQAHITRAAIRERGMQATHKNER